MGSLIYDESVILDTDDRTLMHLQAVVLGRFRREEGFVLDLLQDGQLVSVWVPQQVVLTFHYSGTRLFLLNQIWIEDMVDEVGRNGALRITPEPTMTFG